MKRVVMLTALVAGCALAGAPMPYAPTANVLPDATHRQTVTIEQVSDGRNESDPTWVGAIRGGYGNPLKVLHSDVPVALIVERAFRDGLRARGLHGDNRSASNLRLSVTVHQFEASQLVRREANMDFSITLTDRSSGRTLWQDRHKTERVVGSRSGGALDTGIFASPDDLRILETRIMSETVDALLDKPAFRDALR